MSRQTRFVWHVFTDGNLISGDKKDILSFETEEKSIAELTNLRQNCLWFVPQDLLLSGNYKCIHFTNAKQPQNEKNDCWFLQASVVMQYPALKDARANRKWCLNSPMNPNQFPPEIQRWQRQLNQNDPWTSVRTNHALIWAHFIVANWEEIRLSADRKWLQKIWRS